MSGYRRKLIEVALPLDAINDEGSRRKRKAPKGYPTQIHTWWAQRPVAAARAVLVAQLLDDPSAWPTVFPTEASQASERERLFALLRRFVAWEAGDDRELVREVRREIAVSWARGRGDLLESTDSDAVDAYLGSTVPTFADPFAGGGTIPLEARRLGLRVHASDLNPVAVLINRMLVDAPSRFHGRAPINREARGREGLNKWNGASGLAADVRYYAGSIERAVREAVQPLYPPMLVTDAMARDTPALRGAVGRRLTTTAWLWARTVASPNPVAAGVHVPLMSTLWLSKKAGREVWADPVSDGGSPRIAVRYGRPSDERRAANGTRAGKAQDFVCVLTGATIPREYIRDEGKAGRLGIAPMAVVVDPIGRGPRLYLPMPHEVVEVARSAERDPEVSEARETFLSGQLPNRAMITGGVCSAYGLLRWGDLFTGRQIKTHLMFAAHINSLHRTLVEEAARAGLASDERSLARGGTGARAYADSVCLYLAAALSRVIDYGSTLATWRPKDNAMRSSLPRQAFAMTWDYAEGDPFGGSSSSWLEAANVVAECLEGHAMTPLPPAAVRVRQMDARKWGDAEAVGTLIASTDPPYYDNISYAELSDFFYVWLRRTLKGIFDDDTSTLLVPKTAELVAAPSRQGGKEAADAFFESGMTSALAELRERCVDTPTTIYYAFKQAEDEQEGTASTGWEKFLEGVVNAGFQITGTWPLRTEGDNRQNAVGANALASSVVLVCRPKAPDAGSVSRAELRQELRRVLPAELARLVLSNIAPVDIAQAAIGPGMSLYSGHGRVLEADGSLMTVRAALLLINEVLDEHLTDSEADYDADTRWAITWFEMRGYEDGPFGEAENLARARNVSVGGIAHAGIIKSAAGKVRLLKREELRPLDYDPAKDERPTVWEYTQHLIRNLEHEGEGAAAGLLKMLGPHGETARALAYRLYNACERRKWAEEARSYNGLVIAWPELEKIAAGGNTETKQTALDLGGEDD